MKRILIITLGCLGLLILFVFASNVYIYFQTKSYIYESVSDVPVTETALVLGAAVSKEGWLSEIFIDRADMAIALYKAGKVSNILVSGDNSTVDYNEVNPARLYLIEKGVPDEDVFLDHAGFDTYSSMYRARDVFAVSSITISTQSFHLPRSVFIARSLGIDAYGINADVGHMLFRNYLREILANEKAILNLILDRQPKFTGGKIPIADDLEKGDQSGLSENDSTLEIPIESEEPPTGAEILPFDSGVQGKVLRGPVCPVMQNPPQPECDDQPFETTVKVIKKSGGKETLFADSKTNANGEYSFQLPPGEYVLSAQGGTPFPSCQPKSISVKPKVMQEVTLTCDTGIR